MKKHVLCVILTGLSVFLLPLTSTANPEVQMGLEAKADGHEVDNKAAEPQEKKAPACAAPEASVSDEDSTAPAGVGVPPYPGSCEYIGDCNRWDSQYCDYYCAGYDCCRATVLIPGAYCGQICA